MRFIVDKLINFDQERQEIDEIISAADPHVKTYLGKVLSIEKEFISHPKTAKDNLLMAIKELVNEIA